MTPSSTTRAVTLLESLTVLLIMGIVIFLTLPHLTNSKARNELAAAKAKATQLNLAKDAYIGMVGIELAQNRWSTPSLAGFTNNELGRFNLIRTLIKPATTATALNGIGGFSVPGYVIVFSPNSSAEKLIGSPPLLYQDSNLNGSFDTGEPQIGY